MAYFIDENKKIDFFNALKEEPFFSSKNDAELNNLLIKAELLIFSWTSKSCYQTSFSIEEQEIYEKIVLKTIMEDIDKGVFSAQTGQVASESLGTYSVSYVQKGAISLKDTHQLIYASLKKLGLISRLLCGGKKC